MRACPVLLASLLLGSPIHAAFPEIELQPVAIGQFFSPTTVTHAGDERLFITDQRGQIHIFEDAQVLPTPLLDLGPKLVSERAGYDERGLLGLAFHPDYATASAAGEGRFYVYYSAPSPNAPGTASAPVDHQNVIAEYQITPSNPNLANAGSERILLSFDQPQFNHDGGQLAFGPDGFLYISTGDGGSSNDNDAGHTGGSPSQPSGGQGNSQDKTNLLGKVLRIDSLGNNGPGGEFGIPGTNPFVGDGGGVREEIYAYGLRNPWRFSFDDGPGGTNELFLADVGQGRFEEINLIEPGDNYGWRRFEGFELFDNTTPSSGPYRDPIAAYAHPGRAGSTGLPEIGLSITGGHVYRGTRYPDLVGKYLFADWSTGFGSPNGTLLGLEETTPDNYELSVLDVVGGNPIGRYIPCFGEGADGELYVATRTALAPSARDGGEPSGQLFMVTAPSPVQVSQVATRDNSIFEDLPANANGLGDLFAGLTSGMGDGSQDIRRTLVGFDLSTIPGDAVITDAALSLNVVKTSTGSSPFTVHRLTRGWGEGASLSTMGTGAPAQTGDCTWNESTFGVTSWTTPGGDFISTPSATQTIGAPGLYSWTSATMIADATSWIDDSSTNHGWIIRGDETTGSAKRFDSREPSPAAIRPTLTLDYFVPNTLTRRQVWERQYFEIGKYIDQETDEDLDQILTLLEYAWDLNPGIAENISEHLELNFNLSTGKVSGFFRRDPRADDLTYVLEISTDLASWSPLVTSTLGSAPTGSSFTSETTDPSKPETEVDPGIRARS